MNDQKTVNITIDDKAVSVLAGTTVIEAAKQIGVEIPHYCYHPGLSIAGNCRMCLVEIEKAPKPQIACNTFVSEGMVVKTKTENVEKMRRSVMEFLLINHPLDCPTCDQAGECRLQDYYMSYDEIPSRFAEEKVHKDKMVDLGASVMLDQERCIACTRCIRFCQEVAGKDELALTNRGDHVTITTFPGKPLSNPYAGNVVDICPVGALTNKDFRYKKRVWMLKSTQSICPGCSRGCNITINHADSKVYRLVPRLNEEVNKYWMCDQGRFGYKFINDNRLLRPSMKVEGKYKEVQVEEALFALSRSLKKGRSDEVAVVGYAWESSESLKSIKDFAVTSLKTDLLFFSKNEPAEAFHDDILITADKNPNVKGAQDLSFKPFSEVRATRGVIVLGGLSEADSRLIVEKKIPVLAYFGSNQHPLTEVADVILPIPTFAEQDGHFTNVQGLKQPFKKAFEPRGEARSVPQLLGSLADMLQTEVNSNLWATP